MLPAAGAIALVAPLSSQLVHRFGVKLTITAGMLLVAGGLWQISGATTATGYSGVVVGWRCSASAPGWSSPRRPPR